MSDAAAACVLQGSRRVLVTGARGYMGSALVDVLAAAGHRVTRHSRSPLVPREHVRDVTGSLVEPTTWEHALAGAEVVFHLAGQTSVYRADQDPLMDLAANVTPVLTMLQVLAGLRTVPTVVFASTATVFGVSPRLPVDETQASQPASIYDIHKQTAEAHLAWANGQGWVRSVAVRFPNVFGPGQAGAKDRGILNRWLVRAWAGENVPVYRPGTQLRDYVFLDDAVGALCAAAQHVEALHGRHAVIGTGQGTTLWEAAQRVARCVADAGGAKVNAVLVEPPVELHVIEDRHFVANPAWFAGVTGWKATVDLDLGLQRTLRAITCAC